MRDFFDVLKRRTARKKHDALVLAFFKLAEDGTLPSMTSREDLEIAALRYNTRKLEPGAARDIMRSYGVSFDYDPGEAPDPTPAPAPAPTPAPTP